MEKGKKGEEGEPAGEEKERKPRTEAKEVLKFDVVNNSNNNNNKKLKSQESNEVYLTTPEYEEYEFLKTSFESPMKTYLITLETFIIREYSMSSINERHCLRAKQNPQTVAHCCPLCNANKILTENIVETWSRYEKARDCVIGSRINNLTRGTGKERRNGKGWSEVAKVVREGGKLLNILCPGTGPDGVMIVLPRKPTAQKPFIDSGAPADGSSAPADGSSATPPIQTTFDRALAESTSWNVSAGAKVTVASKTGLWDNGGGQEVAVELASGQQNLIKPFGLQPLPAGTVILRTEIPPPAMTAVILEISLEYAVKDCIKSLVTGKNVYTSLSKRKPSTTAGSIFRSRENRAPPPPPPTTTVAHQLQPPPFGATTVVSSWTTPPPLSCFKIVLARGCVCASHVHTIQCKPPFPPAIPLPSVDPPLDSHLLEQPPSAIRPRLSVVAKPRLGDRDQHAAKQATKQPRNLEPNELGQYDILQRAQLPRSSDGNDGDEEDAQNAEARFPFFEREFPYWSPLATRLGITLDPFFCRIHRESQASQASGLINLTTKLGDEEPLGAHRLMRGGALQVGGTARGRQRLCQGDGRRVPVPSENSSTSDISLEERRNETRRRCPVFSLNSIHTWSRDEARQLKEDKTKHLAEAGVGLFDQMCNLAIKIGVPSIVFGHAAKSYTGNFSNYHSPCNYWQDDNHHHHQHHHGGIAPNLSGSYRRNLNPVRQRQCGHDLGCLDSSKAILTYPSTGRESPPANEATVPLINELENTRSCIDRGNGYRQPEIHCVRIYAAGGSNVPLSFNEIEIIFVLCREYQPRWVAMGAVLDEPKDSWEPFGVKDGSGMEDGRGKGAGWLSPLQVERITRRHGGCSGGSDGGGGSGGVLVVVNQSFVVRQINNVVIAQLIDCNAAHQRLMLYASYIRITGRANASNARNSSLLVRSDYNTMHRTHAKLNANLSAQSDYLHCTLRNDCNTHSSIVDYDDESATINYKNSYCVSIFKWVDSIGKPGLSSRFWNLCKRSSTAKTQRQSKATLLPRLFLGKMRFAGKISVLRQAGRQAGSQSGIGCHYKKQCSEDGTSVAGMKLCVRLRGPACTCTRDASFYCALLAAARESKGEVNVGRRQMKRDGLRKLEMQYSVRPVTRGIRSMLRAIYAVIMSSKSNAGNAENSSLALPSRTPSHRVLPYQLLIL
ncbi:hypothetical protein WN51_04303 [Melipona quadrifasciata]|uniref:Uncharacterized protein n=1 Tax=Melipona quadrifasciata TaxID=166423 RepID=A0A0M8ZR61_9HYME|nr:hypothetical protein WN51_04303 [Melipona quadrifasciata]